MAEAPFRTQQYCPIDTERLQSRKLFVSIMLDGYLAGPGSGVIQPAAAGSSRAPSLLDIVLPSCSSDVPNFIAEIVALLRYHVDAYTLVLNCMKILIMTCMTDRGISKKERFFNRKHKAQ